MKVLKLLEKTMEDGEDADLKDWRLELRDISVSEG